jgi:HD superfamily phosphohydrolase YqeK
MIDIINAKKEFKKYISNYNPEHPRVALKISHIGRVTENCKMIAEYLGLSDEEVKLAQLIGLFHDIGRFEQIRIADTFSDKDSGVNHAELSNNVLFEDGLIRNFITDDSYDKIIKTAVYNHNRAFIDPNISEKEMLFSKIIRDADKLDIFYVTTFEPFPTFFWHKGFNQDEINSIVLSQVEQKSLVDYTCIKNNADQITIFYAYVFDLYFDITLQIVKENKYLETYTENIKKNFKSEKIHKQANHLLEVCNAYIKQKTEGE